MPQYQDFSAAYDTYADEIFRFCHFKVGNRDDALDITQETFAKTWVYLEKNGTVQNIRAFLYQVARNMIVDFFRKKKSYSLDAVLEEGIDFGSHDHISMIERTEAQISISILELLNPLDRELLVLRYVQDMDIPDIARLVGHKENTVSVRIHRALKKAKELIEKKNTYET
ncbi:MAG: RNA polymerase sigma factor [Candidatus Pacebacteria bacterium]|nr:RNA polymerase sigma factor [Candidatus Paceibacterota bacterium]MCD8563632.1 RNA polymerase sigma factor [Candidatus Paceibacterota bacterium]